MPEQKLQLGNNLYANEPLWKRVPTRDADGKPLTDFMMLIPKLRSWPKHRVEDVMQRIQGVLAGYGEQVEYADLNMNLNLLWVSVRSSPGICVELPAALQDSVPEAVLVASRFEAMMGAGVSGRRKRWLRFLPGIG